MWRMGSGISARSFVASILGLLPISGGSTFQWGESKEKCEEKKKLHAQASDMQAALSYAMHIRHA